MRAREKERIKHEFKAKFGFEKKSAKFKINEIVFEFIARSMIELYLCRCCGQAVRRANSRTVERKRQLWL